MPKSPVKPPSQKVAAKRAALPPLRLDKQNRPINQDGKLMSTKEAAALGHQPSIDELKAKEAAAKGAKRSDAGEARTTSKAPAGSGGVPSPPYYLSGIPASQASALQAQGVPVDDINAQVAQTNSAVKELWRDIKGWTTNKVTSTLSNAKASVGSALDTATGADPTENMTAAEYAAWLKSDESAQATARDNGAGRAVDTTLAWQEKRELTLEELRSLQARRKLLLDEVKAIDATVRAALNRRN